MRTFIVAAALAAAFSAVPASAASVTYTYLSQPFGFAPRDPSTGVRGPWVPCTSLPDAYECMLGGGPVSGTLTISDQYPGGRIAGSSIRIDIVAMRGRTDTSPCEDLSVYCTSYTVLTGNGDVIASHAAGLDPALPFLQYSGYLSNYLWGTIVDGSLYLKFGSRGQIVAWSGYNMNGGDFDPYTYGDEAGLGVDSFTEGAYTLGPGRWTGTANVPVPATGGLLAAAAAATAWVRRKRAV